MIYAKHICINPNYKKVLPNPDTWKQETFELAIMPAPRKMEIKKKVDDLVSPGMRRLIFYKIVWNNHKRGTFRYVWMHETAPSSCLITVYRPIGKPQKRVKDKKHGRKGKTQ